MTGCALRKARVDMAFLRQNKEARDAGGEERNKLNQRDSNGQRLRLGKYHSDRARRGTAGAATSGIRRVVQLWQVPGTPPSRAERAERADLR
jgi:hypothetical protein